MKKTVFLAIALFTLPAVAQDPPKKIDVGNLPKQTRVVEDIIVPVPSEIFNVLDKIGRVNWVAVQRPIKGVAEPMGSEPQQALYIGTVIAEGFIAVEAQDAEEVKNIGRSVIKLSKSLGVEKAVTKRANAIIVTADKADWPGVRRELDGALNEVKDALQQLNSVDLANLVALGGWVRGTEALCEVVSKEYKEDGADLLHQPFLVNHFETKVKGIKLARHKSHPLIPQALTALQNAKPIMAAQEGAVITKQSVEQILRITAELVKAIQTKPAN